ncbi:MAG: nascent polypeptide-associated complex protein [Nitrosarchaeum sp.]|nr:nascent polypeptide-associated complex protein [Nitrosarchaeum sp.]
MMPGMNPRMMKQAMKRMGIQQDEIEDAQQVIIRCSDREIVIDRPQVSKVMMMGQATYQVVGQASERALDQRVEVSEEDVQTVVDQAGVSEEEARTALEETNGDIAEAILRLQG